MNRKDSNHASTRREGTAEASGRYWHRQPPSLLTRLLSVETEGRGNTEHVSGKAEAFLIRVRDGGDGYPVLQFSQVPFRRRFVPFLPLRLSLSWLFHLTSRVSSEERLQHRKKEVNQKIPEEGFLHYCLICCFPLFFLRLSWKKKNKDYRKINVVYIKRLFFANNSLAFKGPLL